MSECTASDPLCGLMCAVHALARHTTGPRLLFLQGAFRFVTEVGFYKTRRYQATHADERIIGGKFCVLSPCSFWRYQETVFILSLPLPGTVVHVQYARDIHVR
jgi:hypothetical protein